MARNLHSLKLHVFWIPTSSGVGNEYSNSHMDTYPNSPAARFGLTDAEAIMRRPDSRLRTVSIGWHMFQGSWVQKRNPDGTDVLNFEVAEENISEESPRRKGTTGGLGHSLDFH
jgi:hypothetical protein